MTAYDDLVLAKSPLGYWKLDEASGTTASDASGNARHFTLSASGITYAEAALAPGLGVGMKFSGAAGVGGSIAGASWMGGMAALTFEAWVKPNETGIGTYIGRMNFNTGLNADHTGGIGQWNDARHRAWIAVGNGTASSEIGGSSAVLTTGTVYHVVGVYDGATLKLYRNGVEIASVARTGTVNVQTGSIALYLAREFSNFGWYDGTMSNVAMYASALSASDVLAHYNAGSGVVPPTVVSGHHITQTTTVRHGVGGLVIINLYPNPSFETVENWAGFSGSTNPTTSTEQAYVGTKSLKVERGAGTVAVIARRTNFAIECLDGAGVYTISARFWAPSFVVDPRLRLSGAGVTAYAGQPLVIGLGRHPWEAWTEPRVITFQWDGVGVAALDLTDNTVTPGAYFYVDSMIITKTTGHIAYFDGDTADTVDNDYQWLGTPHNSRSRRIGPHTPTVISGHHITQTTTVHSGTVTVLSLVSGHHISEITTVHPGTILTTIHTVVHGNHIAEITTVHKGKSRNTVIAVTSDSENRSGGRWRSGVGYAMWTPELELPPVDGPAPRVSALAFTTPTVDPVNGRVAYTASRVEQEDYIDRLIVGGTDVTFWRGVHTPIPSFVLVEPFGYGPASITFPQVAASFEEPGVGALRFLRHGASVRVQRVNLLTGEIVATDYKGIIISHDISGSSLTCQIGGEATGRAALREQQVPIFTWKKDSGRMIHDAIRALGLRFEPYLGPVTGIRLQRFGGTGMLDYMQQIIAMSWNRNGNRWTVMPNEETGAYEMFRKDRTTIHATAYLDDGRTVGSLLRDMAEEPNRYYMTGVTPEGMRVRFGAYPGLKYTEPPPYPFTSGETFGQGTTDADTDTGDGVTIMINRLFIMKYLDRESLPGGYDIDVTRAVRDLQRDGGLNVTGDVNPNTWRVLYDFETTGWSLRGSQILPAAESEKVKKWNRTPSGARLSRNPEYDPSVPPVDRNVDVGTGYERTQMREWARSELEDARDDNWVGSITFSTLALIKGEHNPGDALTEADIMPARDLRPGMNIWLPTYAGGILVHVSSVSVTGTEVSVEVDTRARDALEVWEVIARNRESRRSLRRAFIREHRSSTENKDSTTPWDEVGGVVGDKIPIEANTWTVFPVIAGQEGTIARLRVDTNPNAEFVLAVFGKRIWPSRLDRSIGNPLTKEGSKKWSKESVRDSLDKRFIMLYVAGSDEEPLGYFPKTKTGEDDDSDEGSTAPLTGRWEDDAGFPYRCFNAPVLWVAMYADRETSIPAGRMMWPQLESGT